MDNIENVSDSIFLGIFVATFLLNTGRGLKAIELCKECLILLNIKGIEEQHAKLLNVAIYQTMSIAYCLIRDYTNEITCEGELFVLFRDLGGGALEGRYTIIMAKTYARQCRYVDALRLYERAINIMIETEDRKGEAHAYGQCGSMSIKLAKYDKAKEYIEKAVAIRMEIGDKEGVAADYGNLGEILRSLGKYVKAKEYFEKALAISVDIGDRKAQAACYGNLGIVFQSFGEYVKAQKYFENALVIKTEIGDREGEAAEYGNLGVVFQYFGEYAKSQEYLKKALAIIKETGDRKQEAACYGNLGAVFGLLGEYTKARGYREKALAISIEISDKKGEAAHCGKLGVLFHCIGEYAKAQEYLEKALAITIEIGDIHGTAVDYGNLGTLFQSLGEYAKAQEYLEESLAIAIKTGDKNGEATIYGNLGTVFRDLGEYAKAQQYIEKALAIKVEIGEREGEATDYGNLGTVSYLLGKYVDAQQYIQKGLTVRMEIGDRKGEAVDYANLANVFLSIGQYVQAEEYLEKSLLICKDIGDGETECKCLYNLFYAHLLQENLQEAFNYLHQSIRKTEELRVFLEDNDQLKISFSDVHLYSYQKLSDFFCTVGKPKDALCVEELGRARALADLMAARYSLENKQIAASPHLWIENFMKKERNCTCLYITYHDQDVLVWIVKVSGVIHFRRIKVIDDIVGSELVPSLDDFFDKSFRRFRVLPKENCEDRYLNDSEPKMKSSLEENLAALRLVEDDDEKGQDLESSISLCYRMVISPVVDLLEEPEILIVPDRFLNQVPFAALHDERGKYLSETFRIRVIPSLSTLKIIQDSRTDYHSQTGALIVGDPRVGQVFYNGRVTSQFGPLDFAKKEAEMIGRLLDVQPLLGECATKRAVLDQINSVSLIHFAAHGNAERGEIALAPTVRSATRPPEDKDYLLTMSDISKVQLRAKLVVLSCCHSGRGQIRAEGVVGIARAFLGSGARSVLVALWALEDRATGQLMSRFYEHLAAGESASESLHEAMKWMRGHGFPNVADWAPFVLIGDDVAFDFGKSTSISSKE